MSGQSLRALRGRSRPRQRRAPQRRGERYRGGAFRFICRASCHAPAVLSARDRYVWRAAWARRTIAAALPRRLERVEHRERLFALEPRARWSPLARGCSGFGECRRGLLGKWRTRREPLARTPEQPRLGSRRPSHAAASRRDRAGPSIRGASELASKLARSKQRHHRGGHDVHDRRRRPRASTRGIRANRKAGQSTFGIEDRLEAARRRRAAGSNGSRKAGWPVRKSG